MRRLTAFVVLLAGLFFGNVPTQAQNPLNASPDNIIGEYEVSHQGELSKVKVTRTQDGTYRAQIFWIENRLNPDGSVRLDEKNPEKSLRNVECDQVVLIEGLRYDESKGRWGETKVYDPTRGIRANVVCWFEDEVTLRVKGSVWGFSQSMFWKKL